MNTILYNNVLERIGKPAADGYIKEPFRGSNIIPLKEEDKLLKPEATQNDMKTFAEYTDESFDKRLLKTPMECNAQETYFWSDDLETWCTYKKEFEEGAAVNLHIWDCVSYQWLRYDACVSLVPIWQQLMGVKIISNMHFFHSTLPPNHGFDTLQNDAEMVNISIVSKHKINYSIYDDRFAAKRTVVKGTKTQRYWTTALGCPMIQRTSSNELMYAIRFTATDGQYTPYIFNSETMKTFLQYAQEVFGSGKDKTVDDTVWKKIYEVHLSTLDGYAIYPYSFELRPLWGRQLEGDRIIYASTYNLNIGTLEQHTNPTAYANIPHSNPKDVAAYISASCGIEYSEAMLWDKINQEILNIWIKVMSVYENGYGRKWVYLDNFNNMIANNQVLFNNPYTFGYSINGVDDSNPLDVNRAFLVNDNKAYKHTNGYDEKYIVFDYPTGTNGYTFTLNVALLNAGNNGNNVVLFQPVPGYDLWVSIRGEQFANGTVNENNMTYQFTNKPCKIYRHLRPQQRHIDSSEVNSYKHYVYKPNELGEGTAKLKFDINNIDINGDVPYEGFVQKW